MHRRMQKVNSLCTDSGPLRAEYCIVYIYTILNTKDEMVINQRSLSGNQTSKWNSTGSPEQRCQSDAWQIGKIAILEQYQHAVSRKQYKTGWLSIVLHCLRDTTSWYCSKIAVFLIRHASGSGDPVEFHLDVWFAYNDRYNTEMTDMQKAHNIILLGVAPQCWRAMGIAHQSTSSFS